MCGEGWKRTGWMGGNKMDGEGTGWIVRDGREQDAWRGMGGSRMDGEGWKEQPVPLHQLQARATKLTLTPHTDGQSITLTYK